jgi:hypothetical protein
MKAAKKGGRQLSKFMASKPQKAARVVEPEADESEEEEEEEDEGGGGAFEEEESEEEAALTAVERRAARLDAKKAAVQTDARAEAEDAAVQEYEPFELPSEEALEAEQQAPDLPSVRRRIQDVARVLANFKRLRQPGRTRGEYMERLTADLGRYYGCAAGARTRTPPSPADSCAPALASSRAQLQRLFPGVHPECLQRGGGAGAAGGERGAAPRDAAHQHAEGTCLRERATPCARADAHPMPPAHIRRAAASWRRRSSTAA